jgi:cation transport ATPase
LRNFGQNRNADAGIPQVETLIPADGFSRRQSYAWPASLKATRNHPLARAVLAFTGAQDLREASEYTETPAWALGLNVGKAEVLCGSAVADGAKRLRQSPLFRRRASMSALDGRAAGCITFTDTLRPDAPSGVSRSKPLGLEPVMLSGDGAKAARK